MSRKSSIRARKPQRKRSAQPDVAIQIEQPEQTDRKRGIWLWILGVLIVLLIGIGCWHGITSNAPVTNSFSPASSSANANSNVSPWKTVQTFSGPTTNNVDQKLQTFTVSSNWQMTWDCQGVNGVDQELLISIYNSNGSLYNAGAQLTCLAAKPVIGSAQEVSGGTFYLIVNSSTAWKVSIQVPT